jgi:hypothetical protein
MCLSFFLFGGNFLMEEHKIFESDMTGQKLDELICDIFEILKEIETINKGHLDNEVPNSSK